MNKLLNTFFWVLILLAVMAVLLRIVLDGLYTGEESGYTRGSQTVTVRYHKAEAGNDKIFGYRVPYGIVWRTGSGDATEIHFSEDGFLEGKKVKAGTYSLWSVPGEKEWVLILNTETGQYGTLYNPASDYLRVKIVPETVTERRESLSIELSEGEAGAGILRIAWENTMVEARIK